MFYGVVVAQAGWLEAVANPIRLRIVRHLSDCESASLDDLSKAVSAQRNTVRAHLRALIGAGVVARLPGQSDGSLGRPPARYRLDRRDVPRARRREDGAPGARSPVAVVVRDYPGGVPAWTCGSRSGRRPSYLLESPWLAQSRGRNASRPSTTSAAPSTGARSSGRRARGRAPSACCSTSRGDCSPTSPRPRRRRGARARSRPARPRAGGDRPGRRRRPRRRGRGAGEQKSA